MRDKELKPEDVEVSHMCSSLACYLHSKKVSGPPPCPIGSRRDGPTVRVWLDDGLEGMVRQTCAGTDEKVVLQADVCAG